MLILRYLLKVRRFHHKAKIMPLEIIHNVSFIHAFFKALPLKLYDGNTVSSQAAPQKSSL